MSAPKNEAMKLMETFFDPKAPGCWDDLEETAMLANNMLLGVTQVAPILRNEEIFNNVADRPAYNATAKMLAKDTAAFNAELKALKSQHEGLKGGTTNPDELAASLAVGMGYQDWMERYQSTVLPNVATILDYAEGARRKIAADAIAAPVDITAAPLADNMPARGETTTTVIADEAVLQPVTE